MPLDSNESVSANFTSTPTAEGNPTSTMLATGASTTTGNHHENDDDTNNNNNQDILNLDSIPDLRRLLLEERKLTASLKGAVHRQKQITSEVVSRLEAEEESITIGLLKRLNTLKKEKETLAVEVEQEEECITNKLTKRLQQLRQEKIDMEVTMEKEQEYVVNLLQRKLSKALAEKAQLAKKLGIPSPSPAESLPSLDSPPGFTPNSSHINTSFPNSSHINTSFPPNSSQILSNNNINNTGSMKDSNTGSSTRSLSFSQLNLGEAAFQNGQDDCKKNSTIADINENWGATENRVVGGVISAAEVVGKSKTLALGGEKNKRLPEVVSRNVNKNDERSLHTTIFPNQESKERITKLLSQVVETSNILQMSIRNARSSIASDSEQKHQSSILQHITSSMPSTSTMSSITGVGGALENLTPHQKHQVMTSPLLVPQTGSDVVVRNKNAFSASSSSNGHHSNTVAASHGEHSFPHSSSNVHGKSISGGFKSVNDSLEERSSLTNDWMTSMEGSLTNLLTDLRNHAKGVKRLGNEAFALRQKVNRQFEIESSVESDSEREFNSARRR